MKINKDKIKSFLISLAWALAGACCIALLVCGVRDKSSKLCRGVQIGISGASSNFFIDKNDVYAIIKNFGGDSSGRKTLAAIDLRKIEQELKKDLWVKNAELFFDNNDILKVSVEEREPVARIFTLSGNTFYTDSSCMRLPLSDKFSARLPVFTGFISDSAVLSPADSSLLCDIKNISLKIKADSFLMAMIDQVDITAKRSFEMTPKIGKQLIIFGDASNADEKFSELKLFYKNVITQAGWNRYKTINLQYKNQVVATIRGKEDVTADSLKTLAMIKMSAEDAALSAADSAQKFMQEPDKNTDSLMLKPSTQRDEDGSSAKEAFNAIPVNDIKPAAKPVAIPAKPVAATPKPAQAPAGPKPQRPVIKKPVKPQKPANDY